MIWNEKGERIERKWGRTFEKPYKYRERETKKIQTQDKEYDRMVGANR